MNPLLTIPILVILALDAIEPTSPGAMFMDKVHTIERMRTTALLPEIANRLPRNLWEAKGEPDLQAQALHQVREILVGDNPAVFSLDVDKSIRAEFEGMVAGDAVAIDLPLNSQ
jgi:trimethylamine--corrinoid protein Co-methyltransferase